MKFNDFLSKKSVENTINDISNSGLDAVAMTEWIFESIIKNLDDKNLINYLSEAQTALLEDWQSGLNTLATGAGKVAGAVSNMGGQFASGFNQTRQPQQSQQPQQTNQLLTQLGNVLNNAGLYNQFKGHLDQINQALNTKQNQGNQQPQQNQSDMINRMNQWQQQNQQNQQAQPSQPQAQPNS